MFGGIGPEKIVLLAIVVLLLFGAKRIPEIGSSFGKGIRDFKKSLDDSSSDDAAPRTQSRSSLPDVETQVRTDPKEAEWQPRRLNQ
ncbi:MAG: twin-arginine translocase TatA/TatE family subunit [Gemmatimonadota bacterium]